MPEQEIPFTGDERVDAALLRIRGKFRDLEDAMIVQAYLEKRQSEQIKDQAEALRQHEVWRGTQAEAIERHEAWMAHMEKKLEALTDILMKREGGPESK
jgi:hypothetical protein